MLLLLPPSETKLSGGEPGTRLDLERLRFTELTEARRTALAAAAELARDEAASIAALKLGPTQHPEAAKNRVLEASVVMPAVDRYTGVLYDALDARSLSTAARDWLARSAVVQTALLGPVGALDPIPDYRLSHDSRLPGVRLKALWADAAAAALANVDGLVVDARSHGYAVLGPAPRRSDSLFLNVVSEDGAGRRRALNHFNKHAKGEFARALAASDANPMSAAELVEWATQSGLRVEHTAPGELTLVVAGQG